MQTLHIVYLCNRLVFPHKEDIACVFMVASFLIARAHGAKVCFFEKDASQKAKQKEVEEEHLTSI